MKSKIKWLPMVVKPRGRHKGNYVLVSGTMDGPDDWRTRLGWFCRETNMWHVEGASWKPYAWAKLPRPE